MTHCVLPPSNGPVKNTKENSMNKTITVNYGADSHRVLTSDNDTIQAVVSNPSTKAILGYGDNVKALVNGVEQSLDAKLAGVDEITLETKANSKA